MRECGRFMRLSCTRIKIETFEVAGPILPGGVAMNRGRGERLGWGSWIMSFVTCSVLIHVLVIKSKS